MIKYIAIIMALILGVTMMPLQAEAQGDIFAHYRSHSGSPDVVDTLDLLKAADDWISEVVPLGFSEPITTLQLLALADEWQMPTPTPTPTSTPGTTVGGTISTDTTWTQEESPYVITDTVQIPSGVTLTIEPGVNVSMPSPGDMFLLHGVISASGNINNKIVFDGGDNSDIITTVGGAGSATLDYCIIRNGHRFWEEGGYFSLTHSELTNLTRLSGDTIFGSCVMLESPLTDCYIEYNRFVNTGGICVYQAAGRMCEIYIRYNLFQETISPIGNAGGSPGRNEMIVRYNSFIDIDGTVLSLEPDFDSANMNAVENYWGILDTDIIDAKIYDRNDSIRVKNYIDYLPILTQPHPSTLSSL